jgi:hypothetical protein
MGGLQGLDPCTNLHFAAMILREQILVHGATWRAVAGYNGADAYAPRVFRRYCLAADDEQCRDPHTLRDLLCLPLASTHAVWRASRPAGW